MKRLIISLLLLAAALDQVAAQEPANTGKRMAVVEYSANYMRTRPDYESGLETQELMGTVVEIVGSDRYWRQISTPQPYTAWTTCMGLVEMDACELAAYQEAPKFIYTAMEGHLYEEPSFRSGFICDLLGGDVLRAVLKGKYTVGEKGLTAGRVGKKHLAHRGKWYQAMLPSGKTGYLPGDEIELLHHWHRSTVPTVSGMLETAGKMLGVPYFWGGMTFKGVDCSGLVRVCAIMNNLYLPRNASQMVRCGKEVPMKVNEIFWEREKREKPDGSGYTGAYIQEMKERVKNLKAGDLVFFGYPAKDGKKERITHVGIYLGGNRIIHSSHEVRKNSLIPGDSDFYENSHKLIRVRRLEMDEL